MSAWDDWIGGVEIEEDLETLIEEVRSEVKSIKARNIIEQDRLDSITKILFEAKLKAKELEHKNRVLSNKVLILEEDFDLQASQAGIYVLCYPNGGTINVGTT